MLLATIGTLLTVPPIAAQAPNGGPRLTEQLLPKVAPRACPTVACERALPAPPFRVPPTDAPYRPTQWKLGGLIGAGVGLALGTIILTTCDPDANSDCPGWGRAAITLVAATGFGALVGAFIHKPAPAGQ